MIDSHICRKASTITIMSMQGNTQSQMRVAFHTLGCKVNHYETEAMREAFVSRGAVCAGDEDPADVYIINTCTVTNIADRKSRQYIRRVKRANPDALIVVTGCYAQVEPEEVAAMPEVDIVVGNGQKSRICELVMDALEDRCGTGEADASDTQDACPDSSSDAAVTRENDNGTQILVLRREELTEYEDMGLVTSSEPGMTRAYIKIQEGCDRFCAYCLIPYARGPVRSRPPEEIVQEAVMLLDSGVREIVLTGINTALYGTEPGFSYDLTDSSGSILPGLEEIASLPESERSGISPLEILLARLDAVNAPGQQSCAGVPGFRIRLSSLEPTVVDKDHVEKIIRYRRLCHHLHLSVQAGSDHILRSMNRHYTRDEYLDIVRAIREYDPLYGITTDIIVGFSGETEEDFADTLDIVRQSGFGKVHVFRYSPRRGTAGAALPDAVPGEIKNERASVLEEVSAETAAEFMRSSLYGTSGVVHTVLAEEVQDGYMTGYTGSYIKVYIEDAGSSIEPGQFYNVQLTGLFRDGCLGEVCHST